MSHITLTLNTPQTTTKNREHAFFAADISDKQTLIDGIDPNVEVTILNPNRDAVAQITAAIAGQKYSVIHIISHGAIGHLQLGNTALNIETLPQYTQQLKQWRQSLTEKASIIIYGCNVAATNTQGVNAAKYQIHPFRQTHQIRQGLKPLSHSESPLKRTQKAIESEALQSVETDLSYETGVLTLGGLRDKHQEANQFLTQLHQLIGAKIATNLQSTGNSALGGNWEIQQLIPPSPTQPKLPFTESALKTYSGILSFAPKVDFSTGTYPWSVSIGDINGDGKPDLATTNEGSNTTSILLNTTTTGATTPTFAPKVDFSTGSIPFSVSIGDINGDGKPDLATANINNNSTSILLNSTITGATTPSFASQRTP